MMLVNMIETAFFHIRCLIVYWMYLQNSIFNSIEIGSKKVSVEKIKCSSYWIGRERLYGRSNRVGHCKYIYKRISMNQSSIVITGGRPTISIRAKSPERS